MLGAPHWGTGGVWGWVCRSATDVFSGGDHPWLCRVPGISTCTLVGLLFNKATRGRRDRQCGAF